MRSRRGPVACPRTRRHVPAPKNMTSSCESGKGSACCPRPNAATRPNPRRRHRTPFTEGARAASIHEHHGLAAVEDDAVLQVIADRARQHPAFDVAALADEV